MIVGAYVKAIIKSVTKNTITFEITGSTLVIDVNGNALNVATPEGRTIDIVDKKLAKAWYKNKRKEQKAGEKSKE